MLVGYMRVSSDGDRQVLDLQRDALLGNGVDERHLFEDHGKTWGRKGQTPVVERPGQRQSISAASAVNARGAFWYCTYEGWLRNPEQSSR